MYRIENTYLLYALFLIPVLLLLFRMMTARRRKALNRFGDPGLVQMLIPDASRSMPALKFFLIALSMVFLIFGLANPQIGSRLEKVERKGIDIIIALDVSNSMLAQDIKPDRITRAKQSISRLIDRLRNDRIGIVVFAGKAYTQLPITSDYSAAKLFLSGINTEIVPTQGTAIGEAITKAMQAFGETDHGKALIIITDGENHEGDAPSLAMEAASKGIITCTIGMGLSDGSPIPEYSGKVQVGFKKDRNGNTIITKLDEITLQQVATAGNGIYVRASNADAGLIKVFEEINKIEKTEFDSRSFSDYEDRFQYFLAAAFILLLLEFLIPDRKSRLLSRVNIFRFEMFRNFNTSRK